MRRTIVSVAAIVLAGAIFAIDQIAHLNAAVAVLYPLVIVLATFDAGIRAVWIWTVATLILTTGSLLTVHGLTPGLESGLRFLFATVAILLTAGLMRNRIKLREARGALEKSEQTLRNFADAVPLLLFRADRSGNAVYLNRYFSSFTGIPTADVLGTDDWVGTLHPEDAATFRKMRVASDASGEGFRWRMRVRAADGTYRWMILDRRPMTDAAGHVIEWYGSAVDIHDIVEAQTENERLNEELQALLAERSTALKRSERRFQTLFQDLNYAFAEMDCTEARDLLDEALASGPADFASLARMRPDLVERCIASLRTVSMNSALLDLLGYSEQEIMRCPLTAPPHDSNILLQTLEAVFERRPHFSGTTVLSGKDNRAVPVAFGANFMDDWKCVLTTHIDLTDQNALHARMMATQAELARVNRTLTIGALSASIAHELNQPIQALSLDLQSTHRWLDREPPDIEKALAAMSRLASNADRMAGIIERTREHLVQGRRRLEPVNILELAQETRQLLELDLGARSFRLEVRSEAIDPVVLADRVELQQVLVNLVMNASDAMASVDRPGCVRLTIRCRGEDLAVEIEDDGPGISEAHLPVLFDMLFTTKPSGMGMGLQICRTLIEGFGGWIEASNRPGGGALFRFVLARLVPCHDAEDAGAIRLPPAGIEKLPRSDAP